MPTPMHLFAQRYGAGSAARITSPTRIPLKELAMTTALLTAAAADQPRFKPDYTPPVTLRYTKWAGYSQPIISGDPLYEEQQTYIHTQGALLALIEQLEEHNFLYKLNTSYGAFFTWWWYYDHLANVIHQWDLLPTSRKGRLFLYQATGELERDVSKRIWTLAGHDAFLNELRMQEEDMNEDNEG